jgi:hypothetical protein
LIPELIPNTSVLEHKEWKIQRRTEFYRGLLCREGSIPSARKQIHINNLKQNIPKIDTNLIPNGQKGNRLFASIPYEIWMNLVYLMVIIAGCSLVPVVNAQVLPKGISEGQTAYIVFDLDYAKGKTVVYKIEKIEGEWIRLSSPDIDPQNPPDEGWFNTRHIVSIRTK